MIALIRPAKTEGGPAQTSWLDLGEKSLTLEGLHIVVDVTDQPPAVTSLFSCRGGTLTLRDCSLSLVHRSGTVRPCRIAGPRAEPTIRISVVMVASTAVWRSMMDRPSTVRALLSRPPSRVPRPPTRMAALVVV